MDERTWKIGGVAGMGVKATGEVMARICVRSGWHVFEYGEYPSRIRGGHTSEHVRIGSEPVRSTVRTYQVLVALDDESIRQHLTELVSGGALLYDPNAFDPDAIAARRNDLRYLPVPFMKLALEEGGSAVMLNMVAVGASLAVFSGSIELAADVIVKRFGGKSKAMGDGNAAAAKRGYEFVRREWPTMLPWTIEPREADDRILIPGNEALGLGAIAGGLQLYAAYPMTPASSLLHYLAKVGPGNGVAVRHAEDEIGAVNMAIGGAYAGLRAMTGTSGGGFSLMVESLGLAAITETPLVIVNAQRPGPATGLPTWTEQADLRFVLHAAQGEFPRIVLAPGDPSECFTLAAEALNYAEQYQLPVILLTDKVLAESLVSVEPFSTRHLAIRRGKLVRSDEAAGLKNYRRYAVTDDGISPRTIPGTPDGLFLANSDEHDEHGWSDESAANRQRMVEKRNRKLDQAADDLPLPILHGEETTEVTLVGWGSTMGAILDAMRVLDERGIKANFLRLTMLSPFPTEFVTSILDRAETTVLVENNSQAQLGGIIRERTGHDLDYHLLKYDGRPFTPDEIAGRVEEIMT